MKGIHLPALGLAIAAALAAGSAAAQSDSTARGRAVFDKKGCQYCHSYVSRRGAPSVRDMLREFEGDPQRVLKGIGAVPAHSDVLRGGKLRDADQRLIAEWLGADFLPEPETDENASDEAPAVAGNTSATVAVPAPIAASALGTAPAVPAPTVAPAARPISGPAVSRLLLQSFGASGGDRLVVELRGGEPDSVDMRIVDNRLVLSFVGAGLAGVPNRISADGAFQVVDSVMASDDGRTVTITVTPRDVGWTYSGMQARNRLVINFVAQPLAQAQPAPATPSIGKPALAVAAASGGAAAAAGAKTAGTVAGTAARTGEKGTARATDKRAEKQPESVAEKPAEKPAEKAATKVAAAPPADRKLAEQKAAEAKAAEVKATERKVAEAKAAEQARVQEQARKAEQAKAREQTELAARTKAAEEAAARKAERPVDAPAKAPVTALAKAEPQADQAFQEADGGKPRRKVSKRPYKEPNLAPCPPPNPADQVIGVVDVDRAKDIIDRIGCPQCHAYVQKKTGPPFREVLKKYKGDPACVIHRLKTNETHKDEGVTGDIRPDEFKILADYIATRMK